MASEPREQDKGEHGVDQRTVCPNHLSKVEFVCKDCEKQLVCLKCITSFHQTHTFEKISEAACKKKQLQDYIKKVERNIKPQITSEINTTAQQIIENAKQFRVLIREIKTHGEKLKAEVDKIISRLNRQCRNVKGDNYEHLALYKQELESLYMEFSRRAENCKEAIDSGNDITVLNVERGIRKELSLPEAPRLQTASFTIGDFNLEQLTADLGTLKILDIRNLKKLGLASFETSHSTVVSEFKHSCPLTSVERSRSDDYIWVSMNRENYVSLVNFKGQVKQKVESSRRILDISLSPLTGNLWMCCDNAAIYEIPGELPCKRFAVDSTPCAMCMTRDNTVVVGAYKNTSVYSTDGQQLHTMENPLRLLVVTPYSIEVFGNTGDVAVLDWNESCLGGEEKLHVSVLSKDLDLKYQYFGPPLMAQHKQIMTSSFYPRDVAFDSKGHLFIADYNNMCVQVVSGDGQFLSVVYTDILQPMTLTIIRDGLMCVGFENNIVKLIEYKL